MDADDRADAVGATAEPKSVPAMLAWRRHHDPDATFIVTPDGVERSYATLGARVDALAAQLAANGVSRGAVVGVYCWNDPAWVVASFAVWSLGGAVAACGGLTRRAEVERRMELVSSTIVVVEDGLDRPDGLPTVVVDREGRAVDPVAADPVDTVDTVSPVLDSAAAIMFTSGTTGAAKPITFSHRRIADGPRMTAGAYSKSPEFRPRTSDPTKAPAISFNPFGHAAALGRMVFRMYVGRSLLLVPKFDVGTLRDLAARYPIDTLQLTPAMIHSIAYTTEDIDLASLKYVNSGTAPLPIATRERFESRYGVPVLQAYGATEGGVTALERYEDVVAGRRGPGSVGRVPEGMPFRIVDPQGDDVPVGSEGELLGRIDRTSPTSASGHSIEVDRDGWYHTGDLARLDEHGILYITGRLKEMMIVGGFNVYPGEVEDVIRRSPLVRDAVVVPKPDDRLGEMPVAGVVWETDLPDEDPDRRFARLRDECRAALEAYKVPRQWFALDALPLNANGKLDRHRAAELAGAALGATAVVEGGG